MTVPAAMPSVEDVARVIAQNPPNRSWEEHKDSMRLVRDHLPTARAILDLFAPILAEKERDGVMLAAEAIRAHMIGADPNLILGMDRSVDVILKLAAAIRAQGE